METKPLDRSELINCGLCRQPVFADGNPVFYEIVVGQCVAAINDIRTQVGLEMMFPGAPGIAAAFSPTTKIAERLPPTRHLVCMKCAVGDPTPIAILAAEECHSG